MKISSFEWDEGNLGKLRKHRISISDIEDFFTNHDLRILNDHKHSFIESRFIAFGKYRDRELFIAFTFRANSGVLKIRIISARYLHARELRRLHEEIKN
jgi:uncharacterized DUF497 family protein